MNTIGYPFFFVAANHDKLMDLIKKLNMDMLLTYHCMMVVFWEHMEILVAKQHL